MSQVEKIGFVPVFYQGVQVGSAKVDLVWEKVLNVFRWLYSPRWAGGRVLAPYTTFEFRSTDGVLKHSNLRLNRAVVVLSDLGPERVREWIERFPNPGDFLVLLQDESIQRARSVFLDKDELNCVISNITTAVGPRALQLRREKAQRGVSQLLGQQELIDPELMKKEDEKLLERQALIKPQKSVSDIFGAAFGSSSDGSDEPKPDVPLNSTSVEGGESSNSEKV